MKSIRQLLSQELPFFMSVPALAWQLLFFCIPLLFIVVMSLVVRQQPWWQAFTLEHYAAFLDMAYVRVIGRSLLLALATSVTCMVLAFPIAYHLVFHVSRWRNALLFLLILPFWTNLLVQVYAWFFVFEKYGLINSLLLKIGLIAQPVHLLNSPLAIYLVMIYCYLPFMIMPLYAALEKFDRRLFESSADLGASPLQTFTRITLPLSVPGMRTGFFLVFVPSFGEFVIPALMGGGKQFYVGTLISHYFLGSRDPHVGAAFTCITGIVLACSVAVIYIFFKRLFIR